LAHQAQLHLLGLALAFIIWQVYSAMRPKKSAIDEILRS